MPNSTYHIALVGAECEENLALRYIRGALEGEGHRVTQIDFNEAADLDRAARELATCGADIAGLSMVFTYRAREFAELATQARSEGFRGCTIAGGHFAAFNADALLRDVDAIDAVAVGEGETIMRDLARADGRPETVEGLVWRDTGGRIVRNPQTVKPADLDSLPLPARKTPPDTYLGLPIANMLGSRGCTYSCSFCSISAWHRLCGGRRLRLRAPVEIANEVADLYRCGYRIFNFHDDNFLLPDVDAAKARVADIAHELRRRHVADIAIAIKSRPDSVDEELFELLKGMGLFRVFLGIEAGTEESLTALGRRQTLADNERALGMLGRLDLHVCFNMLLLNPESTLDDVRGNIEFLRRHPHNPVNFCRVEVYEGTSLARSLRDEGRLRGSYWGYGYEIRDPRAQQFFEIMHSALFARHHGPRNLHHLSMGVDYERQLLGHFDRIPADLRRRAKAFIREVNLNSCAYLAELADVVAAGLPDADRYAFDLARRVTADGARLEAIGMDIAADIRRAAFQPERRSVAAWPTKAAAAGLVAGLALTVTDRAVAQGTHPFEMAPISRPVAGDDGQEQAGVLGDVSAISPQFQTGALPFLGQSVRPAQDLEVELLIDKEGKVTEVELRKPLSEGAKRELSDDELARAKRLVGELGAEGFAARKKATGELVAMGPAVVSLVRETLAGTEDVEVRARCHEILSAVDVILTPKQREEIDRGLRRLTFGGENVVGKRFFVPVTKEMLLPYQGGRFWRGHICEMAPAPLD